MNSVLIKIVIGAVVGALVGLASIPTSKKLIVKRTQDPGDTIVLNDKLRKAIIIVASVVAGVLIAVTADSTALLIRNLLLLFSMLSISIIDSLIRKIPNSLLLLMIVVQVGYVIYYSIAFQSNLMIIASAFGFAFGFIGCSIPKVLKIPVGAGDIKYSAVIGLCAYLAGYLQAMVIMGIFALVALTVLKATKKGGMKTLIPMGPFLSAGTVISMCFPLLEKMMAEVSMF